MKIALLTPVLVSGDAVSNDVIGMWSALRNHGYDSEIFANEWTVDDVCIHSATQLETAIAEPEDILIYHFSVGWEEGLRAISAGRYHKVVKYHNVTPPEYFEGVDEEYASVCRAGREMLKDVAQSEADLFLSDSAYNMAELAEGRASLDRSFVLPPFHRIDRLLEANCDLDVLERFSDGMTNILMVGRIVPNKAHVQLITSFAAYHRHYNEASRLLIVGKHDPRLGVYTDSIHSAIVDMRLQKHVVFTDEVSDTELKSCLLAAHAFAITSEHEGFCVPLVEAMAHCIPIAAYGSTAVTETVAGAGLVWPEKDPYVLAASLHQITSNDVIAEGLGRLGWLRYDSEFRNEVIEARFFEIMAPLLASGNR